MYGVGAGGGMGSWCNHDVTSGLCVVVLFRFGELEGRDKVAWVRDDTEQGQEVGFFDSRYVR